MALPTPSSPGFVATGLVLLGAVLHPAWPASLAPPLVATAALALLLVLGLVVRKGDPGDRLLGLGALAVVAAIGYDGLRGHRGTLTLEVGQGTRSFEEEGPEGRSLGPRPLGFDVVLERVDPAGGAVLRAADGATIALSRRRSASHGGFRFGAPTRIASGEASALRITVAGPQGTRTVEVTRGPPATVDGLQIALERYFPDFALDEKQQPYSRSSEPRNPAALLHVTRGKSAWRVFVIQAMPGIHRPEGLDRVLTLAGVMTPEVVEVRVSREPAAGVALAGTMLLAVGMAGWARRR